MGGLYDTATLHALLKMSKSTKHKVDALNIQAVYALLRACRCMAVCAPLCVCVAWQAAACCGRRCSCTGGVGGGGGRRRCRGVGAVVVMAVVLVAVW